MTPSVTLYGTAWFELTRDLRSFMNHKKVAYAFRNVENDPSDKAAAMTMNGGNYQVPVVVVGERIMKNPALSVLERELAKQGLITEAAGDGAL